MYFYIIFNKAGRLILIDKSKNGTAINYDGWGKQHKRRNFKWILFLKNIIQVHLPHNFDLDIVLAEHKTYNTQYRANLISYRANLTKYQKENPDDIISLSPLNFRSRDPTALPTQPLSPMSGPIYLPGTVLGEGSYGKVFLVMDVSIGNLYAAKKLKTRVKVKEEVKIKRASKFRKEEKIIEGILYMRLFPISSLSNLISD